MKRAILLVLMSLAVLCMAPNRRKFDHIGNFNFVFAPVGLTETTASLKTEGTAALACPAAGDASTTAVRLRAQLSPAQVDVLGQRPRTLLLSGSEGQPIALGSAVVVDASFQQGLAQLLVGYQGCQ